MAGAAGSSSGKMVFVDDEASMDICVVKPTKEMAHAEEQLSQFGVVGCVEETCGVTTDGITIRDVCYAIRRECGIEVDKFKVKKFYPDDFLIKFEDASDRDTLLKAGVLKDELFVISVKPWKRVLYSRPADYGVKVEIELKGIPAHAWQPETVHKLLSSFCCVESMYVPDRFRPRYRVEAWARSIEGIPKTRWLGIPEPLWSDKLRDVWLDIDGPPRKLSTYLVKLVTEEAGPEPDYGSYHSVESGYGYDTDRSAKGSD